MKSEHLAVENEAEIVEVELCECQAELEILKNRVDLLTKDNAELVSDNLALRAKVEALLEARSALPEFSVKTESQADKYGGVREIFKNKRR